MLRLKEKDDEMMNKIGHIDVEIDNLKNDMTRLRDEQNSVYHLFTENDNKIIENYLKNKEKVD